MLILGYHLVEHSRLKHAYMLYLPLVGNPATEPPQIRRRLAASRRSLSGRGETPQPGTSNDFHGTQEVASSGQKKNENRNVGNPRPSHFHLLACRHFLLIFFLFRSFGAAHINSYIYICTYLYICMFILSALFGLVWSICRSRELAKHQLQLQLPSMHNTID